MNAEERFIAAFNEFAEAYKDYVMSCPNLTVSETLSNGYVGNVAFEIKGKKYELAVGDGGFVCVHDNEISYTISKCFSKSDCNKLRKIVVSTLGEVDKQKRIKELEKELKKLKGE